MQENLKCRVKGQDEAIELVTNAIIRARSGIKDPSKPIGSFIFMGPTGVGKTEIAKSLAYELFDDERHMIRIDCSEYMESFNVSRLLGAPPGYIGYETGGELTEAVRRNPYSTVDFKNTIIIMRSNLGSDIILNNENNRDELVMKLLKTTFRPELINRIDEIITFNSISESIAYEILERLINDLNKRLNYMLINITLTKEAKEKIITESFDKEFGARPVKRYITKHIENLISKYILDQEIIDNVELKIDVDNNEFVIKNV